MASPRALGGHHRALTVLLFLSHEGMKPRNHLVRSRSGRGEAASRAQNDKRWHQAASIILSAIGI